MIVHKQLILRICPTHKCEWIGSSYCQVIVNYATRWIDIFVYDKKNYGINI